MQYEFKKSDAYDFARHTGIEITEKNGELFFKTCPYCKPKPTAGNVKTFSINLSTGMFKCFRSSCGMTGNMVTLAKDFDFSLGNDFDEYYRPKKQFRSFQKMEPVKPKQPALEYLEKRGISEATAAKYNLTIKNGTNNILVFPFQDEKGELQFIKYRKTDFDKSRDNNKEWCEPNCKPILFGMYQCNLDNKTLVLTEGQLDSLSVAEAGIENAVSVPTGAKGFTWFPYCWDWLQNFETLVIFGDCEKGKISLVEEMQKRFKGAVKVVRMEDYKGFKDANELLQKHGKEAVRQAVEQASLLPVKRIICLSDVESVNLFKLPKIATGIASVDKVLSGGLYLGQLIVLSGRRGIGKSTFASQIIANALEAGIMTLAYSGELPAYHFKNWLDKQIAGTMNIIQSDDPAKGYVMKSDIAKINDWYRGKAFLYDNSSIDDEEVPELLAILEDAIKQYGIQLVLIDNLMTAMDIPTNSDLYREQAKFTDKLVKLAKLMNIVVILIAHPRKNSYSTDDTDEISGSADIVNKADVVMTYKTGLDDSKRALSISKNRLTGRLAVGEKEIPLLYDQVSKRISDKEADFGKQYGWKNDGFMEIPADQLEIPFD